MSTTHVAGPVVQLSDPMRYIQRCALCGEKLVDSADFSVAEDGTVRFPEFVEARLIRIEGDDKEKTYTDVGDFLDPRQKNPADFCLELVE